MVASVPRSVREGDADPARASTLVRRDGLLYAWNAALEPLSGRDEASVRGRPLAELIVPLEPRELPDPASFAPGPSWSGPVAVPGSERQPPRVLVAEIARAADADELCLTL